VSAGENVGDGIRGGAGPVVVGELAGEKGGVRPQFVVVEAASNGVVEVVVFDPDAGSESLLAAGVPHLLDEAWADG